MRRLDEAFARAAADTLGRRVRGYQLGVIQLDFLQTRNECVVLGVAESRADLEHSRGARGAGLFRAET